MLSLYYKLPYFLRVTLASLHGYRLNRARYGSDTERLVAEYLDRDNWTPSRWKRWTEERQAFVLHHAATKVPYYRDYWQERRRRGDKASWEVLENWPILDKSVLRLNPKAFLVDGANPRRMIHEITSGTTGTPIDLWFTRETMTAWYAMFEARCRRWHGFTRGDSWGLLAGQPVADPESRKPPFWVWNRGLRQLYLSSYHASSGNASHYVEAMNRYGVKYLVAYPSSLYPLAQGIIRDRIKPPPLEAVIMESEQLYGFQRRAVEQAFKCPVRDSFGMSEICVGAGECRHGSMHLWPDAGVLEVFDGDRAIGSGQTGDLVCTGLINTEMPLIRYRVGDRGRLARQGEECRCGRNLPLLETIEGRISDVIVTSDGRRLSPNLLEGVFDAHLPVEEAQIVQRSLKEITVRVVPAAAFSDLTVRAIEDEIIRRLGPVQVTFEKMARIPRGPNGKLRAVVCEISEIAMVSG